MKKITLPAITKILKDTIQGFHNNSIGELSASLAYATLFSIIPFLSLLVTIGTFFEADLGGHLYTQLQPIIGMEAVDQLKEIIDSAEESNSSVFATIVSLGVTIFGASAIFSEMQGSLNKIWGIKAIPKMGWLKYIRDRLLSFSIILIFAFIMLITFIITNIIENLGNRFMENYPQTTQTLVDAVGFIVNISITIFIFVLLFKTLPDAKIKSKDVLVGAIVTTVLFLVGQLGISLYLGIADVGSVYGAAAFMVILITWIYYSAIIIYIGAEFTEAWANEMGSKIFPDEFAVTTRIIEIHKKGPVKTLNKIEIDRN